MELLIHGIMDIIKNISLISMIKLLLYLNQLLLLQSHKNSNQMIYYVLIGMEIIVLLVLVIIMLIMENALKWNKNANFGIKLEIVKDVN